MQGDYCIIIALFHKKVQDTLKINYRSLIHILFKSV